VPTESAEESAEAREARLEQEHKAKDQQLKAGNACQEAAIERQEHAQ